MKLVEAFEEGPDNVDAGSKVEVEHNGVIEVDDNAFNVFDSLIVDLDEPRGQATTALGMTSHSKSRVSVKNKVRGVCPCRWLSGRTRIRGRTGRICVLFQGNQVLRRRGEREVVLGS